MLKKIIPAQPDFQWLYFDPDDLTTRRDPILAWQIRHADTDPYDEDDEDDDELGRMQTDLGAIPITYQCYSEYMVWLAIKCPDGTVWFPHGGAFEKKYFADIGEWERSRLLYLMEKVTKWSYHDVENGAENVNFDRYDVTSAGLLHKDTGRIICDNHGDRPTLEKYDMEYVESLKRRTAAE